MACDPNKLRNDAASARDRYWFNPGERLKRVNWTRYQSFLPPLESVEHIGKHKRRDAKGRFA